MSTHNNDRHDERERAEHADERAAVVREAQLQAQLARSAARQALVEGRARIRAIEREAARGLFTIACQPIAPGVNGYDVSAGPVLIARARRECRLVDELFTTAFMAVMAEPQSLN